ncbi:hypothetical protein ZWY2020_004741 [Hordeum vulgare]|nr:hypothetical protein ZWY2020_004741 [Hordeum vulgare]
MDIIVPAVIGDIVSRTVSFAIKKYCRPPDVEKNLERLNQLVLRAHTIAEEAEGRLINNREMLQQLGILTEGMHRGRYMLDNFKCRILEEGREDEQEVSQFPGLSMFNAAKCLRLSNNYRKAVLFGSNNIEDLQGMIATLEKAIGDLNEFVIFLANYPPICR